MNGQNGFQCLHESCSDIYPWHSGIGLMSFGPLHHNQSSKQFSHAILWEQNDIFIFIISFFQDPSLNSLWILHERCRYFSLLSTTTNIISNSILQLKKSSNYCTHIKLSSQTSLCTFRLNFVHDLDYIRPRLIHESWRSFFKISIDTKNKSIAFMELQIKCPKWTHLVDGISF